MDPGNKSKMMAVKMMDSTFPLTKTQMLTLHPFDLANLSGSSDVSLSPAYE